MNHLDRHDHDHPAIARLDARSGRRLRRLDDGYRRIRRQARHGTEEPWAPSLRPTRRRTATERTVFAIDGGRRDRRNRNGGAPRAPLFLQGCA